MKIIKGLTVGAALVAPMLLASPAQAAGASDSPTGIVQCTNAYVNDPNPYSPYPKYWFYGADATPTINYAGDEAGAAIAYGICVII